ncbi:MAG TPA: TonB-dependent receptor [Bacteroidia bacterium]|nr:TonB-dependent receptor [Bacteroidia bacterium]
MKKRALLFASIGMALSMHAQTTAQSDSLQKLHDSLKQVTVTATRTGKNVMDAGRDVTLITNEQIKNASCNSLAELLSEQAGIFIVGTGQNPGAVQSLLLRGADDNHTTIMIDGVPVMDPSSPDGAIDISEFSLADVDKIEIVRGSHSTLYGSSSIGGVINIITNRNSAPGIHIDASETAGEFGNNTNVFEEKLFVNYTCKNGAYAELGYDRIDDKGLSAAVDTLKHPLAYQQNPQNNLDKGDFYSKLGYSDNKWNAFLEYRNMNKTFGIAENAFSPANNYIGTLKRDFYMANISYAISPVFHMQYISSYSLLDRSYVQDTTVMDTYGDKQYQSQYYTSTAITNDVQLEYDYKASKFILGGGSNYETMNTITDYSYTGYSATTTNLDSVKPNQVIYNVFAQADFNGATFTPLLKPFSLVLGARYSSNSLFGNNISYEINPSVKIDRNSILYFSYSTGFNAPSLYQLYGPDDMQGDAVSLANNTLKPETSTSYEIGIKHHIDNVYFTLSWFNTVVNDYIDYVYVWKKNKQVDSLTYSDFLGDTYLNVGQETTKGLEMNIAIQLNPKLSVAANMSILSSSLNTSNSSIDTAHSHGNQVQLFNGGDFVGQSNGNVQNTGLLRRPGTMANVTITYKPFSKLTLCGQIRYVGTRTDAQYDPTLGPYGADAYTNLPDYTLLDLSAKYQVTNKLAATIRVGNVFNTTYYEILGYTTLGRSIYLNLRYAF